MSDINITALKREKTTKGAVNQLRRDGQVPGVLYSNEMEPVNITVSELALKPVVYTSEMNLVNLKIDGQADVRSLLKNIQFHPLTDRIVHVDFQAVLAGQVMEFQVPISFIGSAVGVKEGGVLLQHFHKLDVECLPKDLPQHIELDITKLSIGDSINVGDLSFEDIKILNSEESTIVSVLAAKEEEEEEVEETTDELLADDESSEPEVITKKKSDTETEG